MPMTDEIGRLIMDGGNAIQVGDLAAKQGVDDLHASGLKKVRQGLTSLEEINRVITE